MTAINKQDHSAEVIKKHFFETQEKYKDFKKYFTDGSKIEEKVGYSFTSDEQEFIERINDGSSVFSAEMYAIKKAIEEETESPKRIIFTDSLGSVQELSKLSPNNTRAKEILNTITNKYNSTFAICWIPSHCGILGNEKADQLAKEALQKQINDEITPTKENQLLKAKNNAREKFDQFWSQQHDNKLFKLKQHTRKYKFAPRLNRNECVKIARLRFGHTRFTHEHIFDKKPPPMCNDCNTQITTRHIMNDCTTFERQRRKYKIYSPESLNNTSHHRNLINFLKEIEIYNKI